ncbi:MAG: FAD-dependent oxidoreductase [Acidobacteriota bacterium]
MRGTIIVGGGQGGFQTAVSLRAAGYQEPITIVGEEAHLPYQRPPLSKGMLTGKQQERHAVLRPAEFYATQKIELITDARVALIHPATQEVVLAAGSRLKYDALVLATGARNRMLAGVDRAIYLRTLGEAAEVRQRVAEAASVAVIGGGFIGLEVAAAARSLGKPVTVIEAAPALMGRVVAPVVSEYFRRRHEEQGVRILLNATVERVETDTLVLGDGTVVPAEVLIAGIGVLPNDDLARAAGLAVSNGISVDQNLRTADERIYAIGDCAEYPNVFAGARVRLESVQNAVDQAACVAKAIVGQAAPYESVPWFWSDQFDIRMQMVGICTGFDQVVTRGDVESRKFSVFYYRGGKLAAVDSLNRPAEHLLARKIIAARLSISPEQAADDSYDLKNVLS